MPSFQFGAIILGAGASSRMGQPKLLLPWGLTSIIGHLLSVWSAAGAAQIAVVCAPPPHPLHAELDRLSFPSGSRIINPSPEVGMFSSIRAAARWSGWDATLSHWALALGDQPQITAALIGTILAHASRNSEAICQPSFQGRPKHPVIMPRPVFIDLSRTTDTTLRDFLVNTKATRSFVDINDDSLTIDLDSPDDYKVALSRWYSKNPSSSGQT